MTEPKITVHKVSHWMDVPFELLIAYGAMTEDEARERGWTPTPLAAEPYALFLAEPLYLHSTRVHGNGTIVLTLMRGQPIERMPDQVTLIDPLSVSKYSSSGDVHVHLFEECPAVRRAIHRDGAVSRRAGTLAEFHSPGLYAKPCGWCARSRKVPKP